MFWLFLSEYISRKTRWRHNAFDFACAWQCASEALSCKKHRDTWGQNNNDLLECFSPAISRKGNKQLMRDRSEKRIVHCKAPGRLCWNSLKIQQCLFFVSSKSQSADTFYASHQCIVYLFHLQPVPEQSPLTCALCKHNNRPYSKFCSQCGSKFMAPPRMDPRNQDLGSQLDTISFDKLPMWQSVPLPTLPKSPQGYVFPCQRLARIFRVETLLSLLLEKQLLWVVVVLRSLIAMLRDEKLPTPLVAIARLQRVDLFNSKEQ